jgi:hypothetical protein
MPKVQPPTAQEVARSRGATIPDQIDSLIAVVVGMDAEFAEANTDQPAFIFTGSTDTAFQRLAEMPGVVPRLIECLGWDRRSGSTWNGIPVLVGAVCGNVLLATPYREQRKGDKPWIDYRNPGIEGLRRAQARWLGVLANDPP